MVNLIDEWGVTSSAVMGGWMDITNHESVLAALANCASRYTTIGPTHGVDDSLVSWALDEMGTVDTSFFV